MGVLRAGDLLDLLEPMTLYAEPMANRVILGLDDPTGHWPIHIMLGGQPWLMTGTDTGEAPSIGMVEFAGARQDRDNPGPALTGQDLYEHLYDMVAEGGDRWCPYIVLHEDGNALLEQAMAATAWCPYTVQHVGGFIVIRSQPIT